MSIINQIRDLAVWIGELCAPAAERLPAQALGIAEGKPVKMVLRDGQYRAEGAVTSADRLPLFIAPDQILTGSFTIKDEAALHGSGPARIELSRRCPFALEQAAWGLSRRAEAWREGAPWNFAAMPSAKLEAARQQIIEAGAKPGAPFAVIDGQVIALTGAASSVPRSLIGAAALAACAALIAVASITYATGQIEGRADERLAAARVALDQAEAEAAEALAARTAASEPIEAAKAVFAALNASPPVGQMLAALTTATGDEAHLRRLRIGPGRIEGEFAAPDAAALAAQLGDAAPFSAARLKTAARTDATTGLQSATLEMTVGPPQ